MNKRPDKDMDKKRPPHKDIRIVDAQAHEANCRLRWIDRIRILCGGRFYTTTIIYLPRRMPIQTEMKFSVEKVFNKLRKGEGPTEDAERQEAPA